MALKAVDAHCDIPMATLAKVFVVTVDVACDFTGMAANTRFQSVTGITRAGSSRFGMVMSEQVHVIAPHPFRILHAWTAARGLNYRQGYAG